MRLLDKPQIQKLKALEIKREVDEGRKLAGRVDALRQLQAKEEAELQKFRRETLANIHEEITTKAQERDQLKQEVSKLQDDRAEALKPLTKEREELDSKIAKLLFLKGEVSTAKEALKTEVVEIKDSKKEVKLELQRAKEEKRQADALLKDAESSLKEAEDSRVWAEKTKEGTQRLRDLVEKELRERDGKTATKERELLMKEAQIIAREEVIKKEWIIINDQRATLERAFKRLQK